MKPIATLCTETELNKLATRSNFRYGKEICKNGKITFSQDDTLHKVAKVEFNNGETRTVDILSTPKGLKWKCSCTSRKDLFCKHCVAVGLHIHRENNSEQKV